MGGRFQSVGVPLILKADVSTMSGNETFTADDGSVFVKDPDGNHRNFTPSGTFPAGNIVFLVNSGNPGGPAWAVIFDSGGLGESVSISSAGIFLYDGSDWVAVYNGPIFLGTTASPQFGNLGVGIAADADDALSVKNTSSGNLVTGLTVSHIGQSLGTGYGVYITKTGNSTVRNIAIYAAASGSAGDDVAAFFELGKVGIGILPTAPLQVHSSSTQFKISHPGGGSATFLVQTDGKVQITPSGTRLTVNKDLWVPGYDIFAAGGYKQPFNFFQSNVAANQSAVALEVLGLAGNTEYVMAYQGSVMAVSVASNDARTGGTLTVDVTIDGVVTGLQAVLDDDPTQFAYGVQAAEADSFSPGDRLGVKITTDASWAPTTADIVVAVIVEM